MLLNGLMSLAHAPVALVSAPPGYGKSTLLALWRKRDERPFAWVSLEAADNDPAALIAGMLAALDPILDLDAAIGDSLRVPEPPLEAVVLASLVDGCIDADQPFVLVFDDLHLVTERRCHTAIGYPTERLPMRCQLALAARTDPPLPLGKLAGARAARGAAGLWTFPSATPRPLQC